MNKIKKEWLSISIRDRVLLSLCFIISIILFILSFLELYNVIDNCSNLFISLIALLMIIQGILNIKRNKISCIIYFTLGICILTFLLISLLF